MSYKERGTIEETFAPLAAKLCNERTKMPRTIIFCRRCEVCASIYPRGEMAYFEPLQNQIHSQHATNVSIIGQVLTSHSIGGGTGGVGGL